MRAFDAHSQRYPESDLYREREKHWRNELSINVERFVHMLMHECDQLKQANDRIRDELLKVYRALPYPAYLQTEHWQKRRAEAIERAHNRCQLCNLEGQLDVHHRTYERLGIEEPSDLVALCRDCHSKFHDKLPKPAVVVTLPPVTGSTNGNKRPVAPQPPKKERPNIGVGDTVKHEKFGEGDVLDVADHHGTWDVTVGFRDGQMRTVAADFLEVVEIAF